MPYELTWEDRGVYKHFTGSVSYQEYAKSQEVVLSDPRIDDCRYVINDLLNIKDYSLTTEQAEYLAAYNKGASFSNPRLRIAYITRDLRIIFLLKLVSTLSSFKIKAFPTVEEAREWASGKT